jgi:hypothetical protein
VGDDGMMPPLEPLVGSTVLEMLFRFALVLAGQFKQIVAFAALLVLGQGMFVLAEGLFFQANGSPVFSQSLRMIFERLL